jgi:hypothetical protein
MSATDLYDQYVHCGDDPFILPTNPKASQLSSLLGITPENDQRRSISFFMIALSAT